MEIYRHLLLYFVNFMVESSQIRFSLYQENENGLSFWDLDLGPTGSTGHIYRYEISCMSFSPLVGHTHRYDPLNPLGLDQNPKS